MGSCSNLPRSHFFMKPETTFASSTLLFFFNPVNYHMTFFGEYEARNTLRNLYLGLCSTVRYN